jgi:hypothetical protein
MANLPHSGSWLGLPDFGITEAIGGLIGAPRTSQGGSNVLGSQKAAAPMQKSVQGAKQVPVPNGVGPAPTGGGYRPPVTNNNNPQPTNNTNFDAEAQRRAEEEAINSLYGESENYLNQAESAVRADYPNAMQAAESEFATSQGMLTGSKEQGVNSLNMQQKQGQNRKEDALSAARRILQEVGMGALQRFGGSSSAGEAATTLQGVEFQRQAGQTNRQFNDFSEQIGMKMQEVETNFNNGMLQIKQAKDTSIANATRDFQNKLLEIANSRAQIGQAKAQARLDALMNLRNQVFAIQQQNTQFEQTLQLQREAQMQSVQGYGQQVAQSQQGGQQAVQDFSNNTTTTPTNKFGVQGGGAMAGDPRLIGMINQDDDELRGQVLPTRRDPFTAAPMSQGFLS